MQIALMFMGFHKKYLEINLICGENHMAKTKSTNIIMLYLISLTPVDFLFKKKSYLCLIISEILFCEGVAVKNGGHERCQMQKPNIFVAFATKLFGSIILMLAMA